MPQQRRKRQKWLLKGKHGSNNSSNNVMQNGTNEKNASFKIRESSRRLEKSEMLGCYCGKKRRSKSSSHKITIWLLVR